MGTNNDLLELLESSSDSDPLSMIVQGSANVILCKATQKEPQLISYEDEPAVFDYIKEKFKLNQEKVYGTTEVEFFGNNYTLAAKYSHSSNPTIEITK